MPVLRIRTPNDDREPLWVSFIALLFSLLLLAGIVFVVSWGVITWEHHYLDGECTRLCDALGHRKVTMTGLGCVCENPENQKREVYPEDPETP